MAMLNPYTLLNPQLLTAMLKQPMYFVRQEYKRGKSIGENKETIHFIIYTLCSPRY